MKEQHDFAGGRLRAGIHLAGASRVRANQQRAAIERQRIGSVATAAVDDDRLDVPSALQRRQGAIQMACFIQRGNDDGNPRKTRCGRGVVLHTLPNRQVFRAIHVGQRRQQRSRQAEFSARS
jgi:hypothetical protein